ncbi:Oidioi.mRNA.OKI2018_I69.PAR.g13079.t2.cds [Oikopleura dioica]|uniref:Oidioi.mRNA.OKI2018_I69.PAR.g13079.t2.cds n=1 Tax=Oikopleura dioica TaxID=34765 RepID=A0ABN7S6K6_OIKDI|nr:Oidioi.mRNA.OKI2018_I69.PAR.g13079.t2.cds [Oikopleura dioica]
MEELSASEEGSPRAIRSNSPSDRSRLKLTPTSPSNSDKVDSSPESPPDLDSAADATATSSKAKNSSSTSESSRPRRRTKVHTFELDEEDSAVEEGQPLGQVEEGTSGLEGIEAAIRSLSAVYGKKKETLEEKNSETEYDEDVIKCTVRNLFHLPQVSSIDKYNKFIVRVNDLGGHLDEDRGKNKLYLLISAAKHLATDKLEQWHLRPGLLPTFGELSPNPSQALSPLDRFLQTPRPLDFETNEITPVQELMEEHISKVYRKKEQARDINIEIIENGRISTVDWYYSRTWPAFLIKCNGRGASRRLMCIEMFPRKALNYKKDQRLRSTYFYISTIKDCMQLCRGHKEIEDIMREAYMAPDTMDEHAARLTLLTNPEDANKFLDLDSQLARQHFAVAIRHYFRSEKHVEFNNTNWNLFSAEIDPDIEHYQMTDAMFKRRLDAAIKQFSQRSQMNLFAGSTYSYQKKRRRSESPSAPEPKRKETTTTNLDTADVNTPSTSADVPSSSGDAQIRDAQGDQDDEDKRSSTASLAINVSDMEEE